MNNYDPRKTHFESRNALYMIIKNLIITDSYALGDIIEQYILFLILKAAIWQTLTHTHTFQY